MLQLLSWNAYDKDPKPTVQMFLPRQNLVQSGSSGSSLVKRKRSSDTTTAESSRAANQMQAISDVVSPVVIKKSAGTNEKVLPISCANQTPVEGLPTPLHSPRDTKMEDAFQQKAVPVEDQAAKAGARINKARQVISQQFNLEILLKHNELRLIDQELAKCQVSLEQLRRCQEIPYPATQVAGSVASGQGFALRQSYGGRLPESPAPWGVTDGPYSRHYSRWLLPDSQFDGGELDTPASAVGKRPLKSRTARKSIIDELPPALSSRSQRAGKLKSLPAGYAQPKEKATGPLILKRKSDGAMVKLVCPDCARHDFGSAQGFINHCRIGHTRNFASHDQAAEACGEPVEYDEKGAMIGVEPVTTPIASNVHPLIRSARLIQPASAPIASTYIPGYDGAADEASSAKTSASDVSPEFRGSNLTPNLSALVKNKGLGIDLQDMVGEAKLKIEVSDDEESEMEDDIGSPIPLEGQGRHPQVAGTRQIAKPSKSPAHSPLLQTRMPVSSGGTPSTGLSGLGLRNDLARRDEAMPSIEPSPTESHRAPSLIDDEEDDEAHSPSDVESEQPDEGDVNFHVHDYEDGQQVDIPREEFQQSCSRTAESPITPRSRRPSALRRQTEAHEEKHVTFVSPSPAVDNSSPNPKRRKIAK